MGRLLPQDHPVWMQPIFTNRALIESLRSKVIFMFSYCNDRIIASAFDINQDNNQAIFDHTMPLLMEEIYPDPHERPMDLNINTLSNRMQRNNRNHL